MELFYEMLSVVSVLVGAIMVLTLFFKLLGWLSTKRGSPARIAFRGVLDEHTVATVYLSDRTSMSNVRLIGFTDSSSIKGPFPYELTGMVILEHSDGRRTLIPAKSVRMIEIAPADH